MHKKKGKKLTNVSFMCVCVAENCEMLVFFLFSPTIGRIDNYLSELRFCTMWDGILATRGCYACHETMYCFSFLRFCAFFKIFHIQLEEKRKNVSFYTVYVCVKVKLTFVSFFFLFFLCTFPLVTVILFQIFVMHIYEYLWLFLMKFG